VLNVFRDDEQNPFLRMNPQPGVVIPRASRPPHDGLMFEEHRAKSRALPVHTGRDYPIMFLPPTYEPRPVFRGIVFRHSRDVIVLHDSSSNQPTTSNLEAPPSYASSIPPPSPYALPVSRNRKSETLPQSFAHLYELSTIVPFGGNQEHAPNLPNLD
jgi:hypothetical protein